MDIYTVSRKLHAFLYGRLHIHRDTVSLDDLRNALGTIIEQQEGSDDELGDRGPLNEAQVKTINSILQSPVRDSDYMRDEVEELGDRGESAEWEQNKAASKDALNSSAHSERSPSQESGVYVRIPKCSKCGKPAALSRIQIETTIGVSPRRQTFSKSVHFCQQCAYKSPRIRREPEGQRIRLTPYEVSLLKTGNVPDSVQKKLK